MYIYIYVYIHIYTYIHTYIDMILSCKLSRPSCNPLDPLQIPMRPSTTPVSRCMDSHRKNYAIIY